MTALSPTRLVSRVLPRSLAVAAAGIAMRVRRMAETIRHRREAAALGGFNDRMLADIGLSRGDVIDAFAEPPWRDPTELLVRRSAERRLARRWRPRLLRRVVAAPPIVPEHDCTADHPASRAG